MKLAELAEKTCATIEQGAPDLEIASAAGLDIAATGDVTFLANPKYTPQIQETRASAIFLNEKENIDRKDIAVLRAKDPYLAYTRALRLFNPESEVVSFIHPRAFVSRTARDCRSGRNSGKRVCRRKLRHRKRHENFSERDRFTMA